MIDEVPDLRVTPRDSFAPDQAPSNRPPGLTFWQSVALVIGLILLVAVPPVAVVGTARWLSSDGGPFRPEIVLPAILLVGVISLMAVLTLLVLVFSRLDLTSKDGALGMPDGTIQAVIALMLILIFAIVGVYLHGVAGNGDVRTLSGLTRAQLDALPAGEIVSQRGTGGGRWEAVVEPRNEQQDNLALQLLTTISTLVVAVAGFYFGSKSVREATRDAIAASGAGGEVVDDRRRPGPGGQDEVDEPSAYGERSPVTGLGQADVEDALDGAGDTADVPEDDTEPADDGVEEPADDGVEETAESDVETTGVTAGEPSFEAHPDFKPEPDFYPDEEVDSADADEDSPPEAAEGDDADRA